MISDLLNMGLSASVIVFLWLIVFAIRGQRFTAKWHYTVLKIGLFFTLFPISMCISFLIRNSKQFISTMPNINSLVDKLTLNFTLDALMVSYLVVFWFVGATIVLAYKLCIYHKLKCHILSKSLCTINPEIVDLLLSCKRQVGVKTKVLVKTNELIRSPLVIGLLRPTILIPDSIIPVDELRYVFLHELSHIKNKDLWFRRLSLIALILHWYNPFVHLLNKQIQVFSEMFCDESVVSSMTKSERKQYGDVILNMVAGVNNLSDEICVPFSSSHNIKRRLEHMFNVKIMKLSHKILSGIIATSILACGVVTTVYAHGITGSLNANILSHHEEWLAPFESIATTVYDLGDGFTSTVTTTTVTKITSVGHEDEGMFTAEQWDEILGGIASGNIIWKD